MTGIQGATQFGFSDLDLAVTADSGLQVRDQKIFRTGTFTSMNRQTRVWTADDLDLAVENFYKLRDSNIVPNVPLREDHTQSVKDVVGYLTAVRRFGDFLFADWEFVSEADKAKWDTKKWRNRSIEIGAYVANDGTKYDPVVLGLAFVDHPAVEGLYRIANSGEDMPTDTKTPDPKASDAPADPPATPPADPPATPPADPPVEPPPATTQPVPPQSTLVGAHGNAQFQVQSFRLDGREVSDHALVQAHITELETFRTESIDSARAGFVDDLVERKVITGPQGVAFHGLVKTMDAGQFTAFKAGFEGMAPANLFGKHDLGDGGTPPAAEDKADHISVLQRIVANHRATGISEDELKTKPSFIELQTLQSSK
jgi:hypothetical protein